MERDTDDQTAIIVTYEGKHDHERPVPKKRSTPRTAAFLIAAAAAAMNNKQCKTETSPNLRSSSQQSADIEREVTCQKALELGGEKALESARTLLSIGIEIKPCWEQDFVLISLSLRKYKMLKMKFWPYFPCWEKKSCICQLSYTPWMLVFKSSNFWQCSWICLFWPSFWGERQACSGNGERSRLLFHLS